MWKVEIVRVYKSSNLLYEHEDKVIFEVNSLKEASEIKRNVRGWIRSRGYKADSERAAAVTKKLLEIQRCCSRNFSNLRHGR